MSPSLCIRSMATRADMSFKPPLAVCQASAWQVKRDSAARLRGGSSAMSARISAISSAWKSRPQ
ncbi:hypothetical protein [Thiocapsa sp.]|uniref:hypothetical protein n=1 Tax=Thiocapsa sp. TaxID=2024551 RepID=UPI0026317594|nr:hypothetical protein [Thiocapsa sp.]